LSTLKVRSAEVRREKASLPAEICPTEVCLVEVCPAEVLPEEVLPAEVGSEFRVFVTPRVPGILSRAMWSGMAMTMPHRVDATVDRSTTASWPCRLMDAVSNTPLSFTKNRVHDLT
jgi:hypothetical protein